MRAIYRDKGKRAVFGDKSRNGLFSNFLKEYKEYFKCSVSPSCPNCLSLYWRNYLNLFEMKKETDCNFELKKKYNGIQIGHAGRPIRNGEMTDQVAIELMEKHPLGKDLFEKCPTDDEIEALKVSDNRPDEELSFEELKKRYPDVSSNNRKNFLKKLDGIALDEFKAMVDNRTPEQLIEFMKNLDAAVEPLKESLRKEAKEYLQEKADIL